MEIIAIIFVLWLIGAMFPGSSSGSYGPGLGDVCAFIACALLIVALFFYYFYTMAGILWLGDWLCSVLDIDPSGDNPIIGLWLLFALFGPIAIPMIIASICNARAYRRLPKEDRYNGPI